MNDPERDSEPPSSRGALPVWAPENSEALDVGQHVSTFCQECHVHLQLGATLISLSGRVSRPASPANLAACSCCGGSRHSTTLVSRFGPPFACLKLIRATFF